MTAVATDRQLKDIALDLLTPHPANRKRFDAKRLQELTANVKVHGVITPLLVQSGGDSSGKHEHAFRIIAGERRWRAAKAAGLKEVPCIVRDLTEDEALELLLTENLQREDPHPLEEADTFAAWLERPGHDVAGLAAKVNKSAAYIYSRLQLRRLGKETRKAFWDDRIPIGHAQVIARLEEKDQVRALDMVHLGTDAVRSLADFMSVIVEYDLELSRAAFPLDDATLCPAAGSCSACPKRTGFKDGMFPELAAALKEGEDRQGIEDTCLDAACYKSKEEAFVSRQLSETAAAHGSVLRLTTRGSDRWPSSSSASVPFGVWTVAKKGAANAVPGVIVSVQGMGHGIKPAPKLGAVHWVTLKAKPAAKNETKRKEAAAKSEEKGEAARLKALRSKAHHATRVLAAAKALLAHTPEKIELGLLRRYVAQQDTWTVDDVFRDLGLKRVDAAKATPSQLNMIFLAELISQDVNGYREEEPLAILAIGKEIGFDGKKFLAKWDKEPHPGTCSKCLCTEDNACAVDGQPCAWANKEQTLCTACAPAPAKGGK